MILKVKNYKRTSTVLKEISSPYLKDGSVKKK